MRSEYARDSAGMGLTPQMLPGEMLAARVNFKDRHPSCCQTFIALGVWVFTAGLISASVASVFMVNAMVVPKNQKCPDGWARYGDQPLCLKKDVLEQKMKCQQDDSANAGQRPDNFHWDDLKNYTDDPTIRTLFDMHHKTTMFEMFHSLPVLVSILFFLAIGWFTLLAFAAHCAVWSTCVAFVLICFFGFYLTELQGWPIAVVGLAFATYMFTVRTHINQGCKCLKGGLRVLSETTMSLPVILLIAMILFAYIGAFIVFFVNAAFVHIVVDKEGDDCLSTTLAVRYSPLIIVLFSFSVNFCYMVLNFTIAFAMGCWYFHTGDPEAPYSPMCDGLRRALFSRNGNGVCGQAGIIMATVEWMERELKKSRRNPCVFINPIMCIFYCVMMAAKRCLESLTTFALVAVAIEGGPFCATARLATRTLGVDRSARFLIIDATLGWVLKMQACLISTAFGFICFFVIDFVEDLNIVRGTTAMIKEIKNEEASDQPGDNTGALVIVWSLTVMICLMWWMMRRPLAVIIVLVLGQCGISIFIGGAPKVLCAVMAACLFGAIGSLLLHLFAEAACGTVSAMTYCWSLDEAVPALEERTSASQQNARSKVKNLMVEATIALSFIEPGANTDQTAVVELGSASAQAPQTVTIMCPDNVFPGQKVMANINGAERTVIVPEDVLPGQIFQVMI